MIKGRNPFKKLLSNVKISGRMADAACGREKKEMSLTWQMLEEQFNKQNGLCYYLKIQIELMDIFDPYSPLSPSVDRIDSNKGYVEGNFVISTRFCNLARGKCDSNKFKRIIKHIRKIWENELIYEFIDTGLLNCD